MFGHPRHEPEPPVSRNSETSCGHHRHCGTCPSCQRAKAARLHAQEEEAMRIHDQRRTP